ncbi:MAG: Rhs family protein-like [Acidobacteria bacterium]|nr:Rhs family protein-like [Acidobacteriota bacterium]
MTGGSDGSLGSGGSGPTASFGFNANNRINNAGYAYDNAGNMTNDGVDSYVYDAENRTTQAGTATYAYNSERLRVSRSYAGGTTYFVNNSGIVLCEKQPDNSLRDFIYFGSQLIAEATSSDTVYHHKDRTSTRLLTNNSGSVNVRQQTAPFGEVMTDSSPGQTKFKFTSYERDGETGNDYALNRQYSTNKARFSQPDPYDSSYNYSGNDPVNFIDPQGLMMELVGVRWNSDGSFTAIYADSSPSSPGDVGFGRHGGFASRDSLYDQYTRELFAAPGFSRFFAVHIGDNYYWLIGFQGIQSPTLAGADADQQSRFNDAFNDLEKRIHAKGGKNPCAELFGGLEKAEKALKDSKFSVGPTKIAGAYAETEGKNVTINPNNGFFGTSGNQTIQVGVNPRAPSYIQGTDLEIATLMLAHELGHRTGKLTPDGPGRDPTGALSIMNNGTVRQACFPELKPFAK